MKLITEIEHHYPEVVEGKVVEVLREAVTITYRLFEAEPTPGTVHYHGKVREGRPLPRYEVHEAAPGTFEYGYVAKYEGLSGPAVALAFEPLAGFVVG